MSSPATSAEGTSQDSQPRRSRYIKNSYVKITGTGDEHFHSIVRDTRLFLALEYAFFFSITVLLGLFLIKQAV